jgi:RHS repeat-associated protein
MRQDDVVYFIHSDHLGSTSLTTDISGTLVAETRYLPYGEERWTNEAQPTDFTFTGQRAERGFALMDYNARYYDPGLGRFVSADTLVPEAGNPQALNRYAYAGNNPVRYTDPSGHCTPEECPWALTQKLWDRYGPATGAARYRLAAAALAAIKADEAIARANAGGGDLGGLKAAINLDMSNYLLKEGIREYEPRSWTYALEAGVTGGLLTAGTINSGADNSVPFSPSQQRDIIGDPGPTGGKKATLTQDSAGRWRNPDGTFAEDPSAVPKASTSGVHGNSLDYSGPTWLYKLVNRDTGQVMKFGETTAVNPIDRYGNRWLDANNVDLVPMVIGNKRYIHALQYELNVSHNAPWSVNGW